MRPGGPGNHYYAVDKLSFCFTAVFTIKPFDAPGGIDEFLFSSKEGVAIGAYLEPDLRLGRSGLPRLAAGAMHRRVHIFWMNVRLHVDCYSCCKLFG